MTQVSKRLLEKQIRDKVFDSFWSVIAKTSQKKEVELFFSDFFSRAEKMNFAKRLAIALLLSEGYDWRAIREELKVSLNTVGRVATKINNPGWQYFIKKLKQMEDWQKFWHKAQINLERFTGGGRRMHLTDEEIEAIIRSRKH